MLREIEAASRLHATAVANNTHLADFTDGEVLSRGVGFAQEVAALAGLPGVFRGAPSPCSKMPISPVCAILFRCM